MQKSATLLSPERALWWAEQAVVVIAASLFVALCARVTLPLLPFTPVPLTLQNFGVVLVGLMLGSRRGFAALALYLTEGACGLPVFSIAGQGGIAQILGPTGGYLLAYPFAALVAGWLVERGTRSFARSAVAATIGDAVRSNSAFTGSCSRKSSRSCWPLEFLQAGSARARSGPSRQGILHYGDFNRS